MIWIRLYQRFFMMSIIKKWQPKYNPENLYVYHIFCVDDAYDTYEYSNKEIQLIPNPRGN
jgi:hypothetical protein